MKELASTEPPAVSGGQVDPDAEPIDALPLPIADYPQCPDPCANPSPDSRGTDPL